MSDMCSGSEAGLYLKLFDYVCHLDPGLRIMKKKKIRVDRFRKVDISSPGKGNSNFHDARPVN